VKTEVIARGALEEDETVMDPEMVFCEEENR